MSFLFGVVFFNGVLNI